MARTIWFAIGTGVRFPGWMDRSACRQADPELFFPVSPAGPGVRQTEAAKTVCRGCAVRINCLSYALQLMPEGIWGGTTQEERRAARSNPARRASQATGQSSMPGGRA
jgi:WhiB family redox-sensing transcriptional regulator